MSRAKRLDPLCVDAIEDIRTKLSVNIDVRVPFTEASRILAEKYYKGHLDIIPYSELKKDRRIRRWKDKEGHV